MEVSKSDWKLFRARIGDWQEAYMERLVKEYRDLLDGTENASDKFWKLEERIKKDKKHPGVMLELSKGNIPTRGNPVKVWKADHNSSRCFKISKAAKITSISYSYSSYPDLDEMQRMFYHLFSECRILVLILSVWKMVSTVLKTRVS